MSPYKVIPREIKEAILQRVEQHGETANRVAIENGVSPKTVYAWLAKGSKKTGVSWAEHNRLRKENEQLKFIVGELTLGMKRTKKN